MLESLYIKNYILISELNLDFKNGFSAFTGETGAGKSIFMDAIGLLCGDRANTADIRTSTDKALIEGCFSLNGSLKKELAELGYDDDKLIVTREFDREGKNTCRINHRTVSLALLKDTIAKYIDIHSQHEHQYLLNAKYHETLLDAYIRNDELVQKVKETYNQWYKQNKALEELKNLTFAPEQEEILNFKINEIDKAELKEGEDQELEEKIKVMSSYEKIYSRLSTAIDNFDNDQGVLNMLFNSIKELKGITESKEIEQETQKLDDLYYELSDLNDRLKEYQGSMEMDENELNDANERIYLINGLKRKYGTTISGILDKRKEYEEQLNVIKDKDVVLNKKAQELAISLANYQEYAKELTQLRKERSLELEKQIQQELGDLQLKNAQFKVDIQPKSQPSASGNDEINFLISLNPGEPLKPLQKVASGGELSRLMLGLKTIFTSLWGTQLIVFDEIDSGVSGSVALSIGKKMHDISVKAQVFAVTHLAPVAAMADYQYRVSKYSKDNETFTKIDLLNEKQRIEELAFINTGAVTSASKLAAKELLKGAKINDDQL